MNAPLSRAATSRPGSAAIVLAFSLDPGSARADSQRKLPGSLDTNRMLDAWLRINADGTATVFTGKVELGQGIVTALAQIAAEELDLPLARVPWSRPTPAARRTRAHRRQPVDREQRHGAAPCGRRGARDPARRGRQEARRRRRPLSVADGVISAADGRKVSYGELAARSRPQARGDRQGRRRSRPAQHKIVGTVGRSASTSRPRSPAAPPMCRTCGCPACCTAASCGRRATARSSTASTRPRSKALPGVVAVVRDGSFLGVVAAARGAGYQGARRARSRARSGRSARSCPIRRSSIEHLHVAADEDEVISDKQAAAAGGRR